MSHFKGIYKNRCKHNYNNYWSSKEMLWSCTAYGTHHSSCPSATAIENDDNCYPNDDLKESRE
jgi:hypothetical protein